MQAITPNMILPSLDAVPGKQVKGIGRAMWIVIIIISIIITIVIFAVIGLFFFKRKNNTNVKNNKEQIDTIDKEALLREKQHAEEALKKTRDVIAKFNKVSVLASPQSTPVTTQTPTTTTQSSVSTPVNDQEATQSSTPINVVKDQPIVLEPNTTPTI
jgi:uncharacterized membrane protein